MNLEKTALPIARKLFQESPDGQSSAKAHVGDKTQLDHSACLVDSCSSPKLRPSHMLASSYSSPKVRVGSETLSAFHPTAFHKVKSASFTPGVFSPLPQSALPQVALSQIKDSRAQVPAPSLRAADSSSPVQFRNGEFIPCEPFQNMRITERFLKTALGPKAVSAVAHYFAATKCEASAEKFLQSIEFQESDSPKILFNLSLGTGLAYMAALRQLENGEIFNIQQVNAYYILFFTVMKSLTLDVSNKNIDEILDSELFQLSGLSRQETDLFSESSALELDASVRKILNDPKISALEAVCRHPNGSSGNTFVALFGRDENYLYDQKNGLFLYDSRLALTEDLLNLCPELADRFEKVSLTSFAKSKEEGKKASS